MLKLTRIIIAPALGLMLGLSMFTSGAFAQSIGPNTLNGVTHATYQGNVQNGYGPSYGQNGYGQFHGRSGYDQFHGRSGYNRLYDRGWNGHINRYRLRYAECVRIGKHVWARHFTRRVVYRSCSSRW